MRQLTDTNRSFGLISEMRESFYYESLHFDKEYAIISTSFKKKSNMKALLKDVRIAM